jgi:peptidoglycan/LPS O-acetylase OafA/YrhL
VQHREVLGIDLLRFFAATIVFAFHIGFIYLVQRDAYPVSVLHLQAIYPTTAALTQYGWVGVEIFFVISGYVIAFSADGRTRASYVRSRFLRIWPTVWVCATICVVIALLTQQGEFINLIRRWAASMVISPIGPWIDGVYWTLPIEIAFYSFVLLFVVGRPTEWWDRFSISLAVVSLSFWAAYLAATCGAAPADLSRFARRLAGARPVDVLTIHHGVFFALGMFSYRPPRRAVFVAIVPAALLAGCVEIRAEAEHLGAILRIPISATMPCAIWLAAIGFMLLSIRFNDMAHRVLPRPLHSILRGLGLMTYPLYLLHVVVAFGVIRVAELIGLSAWPAWVTGIAVTLLCAAVVSVWVEPAFRAVVGRFLDRVLGQAQGILGGRGNSADASETLGLKAVSHSSRQISSDGTCDPGAMAGGTQTEHTV